MKTSYRYTLPLQVKNHWLIRYKCSIPAFNGLFLEEDNRSISKLLFLLATWHTYTKRLHTETTVGMLDQVCKALCQALRHFTTVTCPQYTMKELPQEVRQCVTCQQTQAMGGCTRPRNTTSSSRTGKMKQFNMSTYKMHCIADYPDAIQKYRTTDLYSTHVVCHAALILKLHLTVAEQACTPPIQVVVWVIQLKPQLVKWIADRESHTQFFKETCQEEGQSQYDCYWMSKKHTDTRELM